MIFHLESVSTQYFGQPTEIYGVYLPESGTYTSEVSSLAGDDTTGAVSNVSFSIQKADSEVPGEVTLSRIHGPALLQGDLFRLSLPRGPLDPFNRRFFRVTSVSEEADSGTFSITGVGLENPLVGRSVQMPPSVGTLGQAIRRYEAALGLPFTGLSEFLLLEELDDTPATLQGWSGDFWLHMKLLAQALGLELVSGDRAAIIRAPRKNSYMDLPVVTKSPLSVTDNRARFVEVTNYNTSEVVDGLVYPPGGWNESVPVINVNAGETVEQTFQVNTSLTSIYQPYMLTFVSKDFDSDSVYTVTGDDGLPIQRDQWINNGGDLTVEIGEDTKSVIVRVTAPQEIANRSGEIIQTYSISLSSDEATGRYSTLRIVGSGVGFDPQVIRLPTGVEPSNTVTEVGASIDNPFIGSKEQAYRIGVATAAKYSSIVPSVSRTLGLPSEDYFEFSNAPSDIFRSEEMLGSRVWDERTRRWFRTRSYTLSGSGVSLPRMDDDLTYQDDEDAYDGFTYEESEQLFDGLSYGKAELIGLLEVPSE